MQRLIKKVERNTEIAFRKYLQWTSERQLKKNGTLWNSLDLYLKKTKSTGCGWIDYLALYNEIRRVKPKNVLECGTGVSTLIIAQALHENFAEFGVAGKVVSMDESEIYLEMAKDLLPKEYDDVVEICYSPTVEDSFSIFRGVRYRDIPDRPYDFVFIDGPSYVSPTDGTPTFDFDFLHVLRLSKIPVSALVDKRVSTCFVLQQLLGTKKVQYNSVEGLGYIRPSTWEDIVDFPQNLSSENFSESFAIFKSSNLRMNRIAGN